MVIPTKYLIVGALFLIGIGSYYVGPFKGKADNPVEQIAEEEMRIETGWQIDLSPEEGRDNDK